MKRSRRTSRRGSVSTKIDDSRLSFLDLPPEIRNTIYSFALITSDATVTLYGYEGRNAPPRKINRNLSPNILRTCKLIQREATPVLYGSNQVNLHFSHSLIAFKTIGHAVKFLRAVGLHCRQACSTIKATCTFLKQAKQLRRLVIFTSISKDEFFWFAELNVEDMVRALGPLIRILHKERKGTDQKQALAMLEFPVPQCDGKALRKHGGVYWTKEEYQAHWRAAAEEIKTRLGQTLK